jgi:hypothetical protein
LLSVRGLGNRAALSASDATAVTRLARVIEPALPAVDAAGCTDGTSIRDLQAVIRKKTQRTNGTANKKAEAIEYVASIQLPRLTR